MKFLLIAIVEHAYGQAPENSLIGMKRDHCIFKCACATTPVAERLLDDKGVPRTGIAVKDTGAANIALFDQNGGQRASMEANGAGESTVRFSDGSQPRIGISVTQAGNAGIALLGGGITGAALSLDQQNRAGLFIYGADGKLAASVP